MVVCQKPWHAKQPLYSTVSLYAQQPFDILINYIQQNKMSMITDCSDDEFTCLIHEECIQASKQCDDVVDCKDKSDEWSFLCGRTEAPRVPLGKLEFGSCAYNNGRYYSAN